MIGAGLLAKNAVERGLAAQAVGEVEPRARLEGRDRVLRARRADAVPRRARLQHRRLRLHDLHRELGPAAGADLGGGRGRRPRRLLGALGQPELRGAHPSGGEGELPRLAAARRRLRPRRPHGPRPRRPSRSATGSGRRGRVPRGHLADARRRSRRRSRRRVRGEMFARTYADVFTGDERWRALPVPAGRPVRLGARLDLRAAAAVLRGHDAASRRRSRTSSGARCLVCVGDSVTTDHISPAGSIKPDSPPAATSSSTASSARTSTPTARGAATTRCWCAARSRTCGCGTCSSRAPRAPGRCTCPAARR